MQPVPVPVPARRSRKLQRIEEMTCNAEARLTEAQDRTWLGEVAALEESLKHLRQRRTEAERRRSFSREPMSGGLADATAGAGDEGDGSGQ